jgi:hypothetical protein
LWILSELIFKEFNGRVENFNIGASRNVASYVSKSLDWPHYMSCRGVLAVSEIHDLVFQYLEYMAVRGSPVDGLVSELIVNNRMCVGSRWAKQLEQQFPDLSSLRSNGIFDRLRDPMFLHSLRQPDTFQSYISKDFKRDLNFMYYFYNIWFAHHYLIDSKKNVSFQYLKFLNELKPYSDFTYERIVSLKRTINHKDTKKTTQIATVLDRELRSYFGPENPLNCMIGIGELENKKLMISVSGSLMESYRILEKLRHFLVSLGDIDSDIDVDSIYLGPPVADTTGFNRFVRFKDSGISVHNGFECVEPKLISGARLLNLNLIGVSVFWMGNMAKRYTKVPHDGPFFSYPCPSCVMNLSDISVDRFHKGSK